MRQVLLVAWRDYLAYVGAVGFWISLITAPLLIAALMFAPVLLARTEPPRVLAILSERPSDAELVRAAFDENARQAARDEVKTYLNATAPAITDDALAAFDNVGDLASAIAAARAVGERRAPSAMRAFPSPSPRYRIVEPPAQNTDGLRPYLDGGTNLPGGGRLYGALQIRRDQSGAPLIEYWSVNLQHSEPANIARRALRLEMQREALAAQGLVRTEADRLAGFEPRVVQFDPRPSAGAGQVTLRQRAPFYAAIALSFILWSVVFSVANMLLTGVIEEKSNKILDTLLTSVSPLELLVGKLLGVAAVSATLFLFWGALGGALMNLAASQMSNSFVGQIAAAFLEPRLIAAFVIGFVAGYLIYGAIFLGLGSLCESIQEAQTLLGPVALVLAMPMMLLGPAMDNPNAPIIEAASWVPIFTPFLLLMRAPAGLSWIEIAGMAALMALTVAILLFLSARIFRLGVVNQVSLSSLFGRKVRKE